MSLSTTLEEWGRAENGASSVYSAGSKGEERWRPVLMQVFRHSWVALLELRLAWEVRALESTMVEGAIEELRTR